MFSKEPCWIITPPDHRMLALVYIENDAAFFYYYVAQWEPKSKKWCLLDGRAFLYNEVVWHGLPEPPGREGEDEKEV